MALPQPGQGKLVEPLSVSGTPDVVQVVALSVIIPPRMPRPRLPPLYACLDGRGPSRTTRRPCRPVLTTSDPSRSRHQPRSRRMDVPGATRSTSSPHKTRPTIPVSSRAHAAAMGPVNLSPTTNRRGYRRRTMRSNRLTGRSAVRSTTRIRGEAMSGHVRPLPTSILT
jgi:hypothetical protein